MRKTKLFLVVLIVLSTACATEDLTVSEDATATWARIIDSDGRTVINRIDFGESRSIDPKSVLTSSYGGSNSFEVRLTANGFRKSDNCPLGSVTYTTTIQQGGGITGVKTDSWHITYFNSSGYLGPNGECLSR